ncbi:MAG: DMT family protein [Planctomycetota bacterium]
MKKLLIPILVLLSSVVMALAWLLHLRFEDTWSFWTALGFSWLLVLPEYALNVVATRWGYDTYSGAQMASMHLSGGVVCVAVVSMFVLGEHLKPAHLLGFATMLLAIGLILSPGASSPEPAAAKGEAPQKLPREEPARSC